mmetsp:Transcript_58380/g.92418  ORF Transcript_58380/g.92418 Transcript_58380/m.92418 type:complete len:338 (-) Transcript_58380:71-1084(-)
MAVPLSLRSCSAFWSSMISPLRSPQTKTFLDGCSAWMTAGVAPACGDKASEISTCGVSLDCSSPCWSLCSPSSTASTATASTSASSRSAFRALARDFAEGDACDACSACGAGVASAGRASPKSSSISASSSWSLDSAATFALAFCFAFGFALALGSLALDFGIGTSNFRLGRPGRRALESSFQQALRLEGSHGPQSFTTFGFSSFSTCSGSGVETLLFLAAVLVGALAALALVPLPGRAVAVGVAWAAWARALVAGRCDRRGTSGASSSEWRISGSDSEFHIPTSSRSTSERLPGLPGLPCRRAGARRGRSSISSSSALDALDALDLGMSSTRCTPC